MAAIEGAASSQATTEALEPAVSHYREGLLRGFYDEWIVTERERIRHPYVVLLERLVARQEARRTDALAIAHARRLLAEDPLREESDQLLMWLHAVTEDRAGASASRSATSARSPAAAGTLREGRRVCSAPSIRPTGSADQWPSASPSAT